MGSIIAVGEQFAERGGWKYLCVDSNLPIQNYEPIGELKSLWDAKRGGQLMPGWRDFALEDLWPWAGWLIVEEVQQTANFRLRIRLWGTQVAEFYGTDFTGQSSDEDLGNFYWPEDLLFRQRILDTGCIGYAFGPMAWLERTYKDYGYFVLPMADDGKTGDRLLVLIQPAK